MKFIATWVTLLAFALLSGSAFATPAGKSVEFKGGDKGKVVFDGKLHAAKGAKCNDCHPKTFQMKAGAAKITMAAMNKGENCGTCHDGKKAFKSSDEASCNKCHKT